MRTIFGILAIFFVLSLTGCATTRYITAVTITYDNVQVRVER